MKKTHTETTLGTDRTPLAIPTFEEDDLDDFAPRGLSRARPPAPEAPARQAEPAPSVTTGNSTTPSPSSARTKRAIDAASGFPSRDASRDGQLNLKGPVEILDRFRAMCKADRRAYYDMLEILMNHFEHDQQN